MDKLNERGLSLIEVLAAAALGAIVISVASMLFFSIYLEFNSTTQKYYDGQDAKQALRVIEKYVSGASDFYNPQNGTEWRFRYYDNSYPDNTEYGEALRDRVVVFYYDGANSLTVYDVGMAQDHPNWDSATTPESYTFPGSYPAVVVSANVAGDPVPQMSSIDGSLITIDISFWFTQSRAGMSNDAAPKVSKDYHMQIKLISY